MPKVPQYQPNQIAESATPNVSINANTTVENYGGGAANPFTQAEKAVESFSKIYREQKAKADQIALNEADAALSKIETDLLYDKSTGALHKQGKASFDTPEVTATEFSKRAEEISKGLGNDEQRAAFKRLQLERGGSIDRTVQRHVGGEIIRHDNNATMSLVKNEIDAAAQSYNDPERIQAALERNKNAISQYASRNGLSAEEAEQKLAEVQSKTHQTVLDRMLANDQDMAAEEYFKKNKELIKGDDLAKIEKEIETGSLRGKSQRFVDGLLKNKLTEAQAIEMARTIEDPKLRDATNDRIKTEYNIRDAAKKKNLEDLHVNGLNSIDSGNVRDVTKIPGWNQMDVGARNSLKDYFKTKVDGKNITTNYSFYSNLKTMGSLPETRDAFLKQDPAMWRNELSNEHFKAMIDWQAGLRKGDEKANKTANGFRTDAIIVSDAFKAAGFKASDNEQLNSFKKRVEDQQIAQQEQLGRKLNSLELRKIADEQAKEIITSPGFFWDDKKKFFELTDSELKNIKYQDVPTSDKLKIEKALKAAGKKHTEQAVKELYIQKTLRDRNGK